MTITENYNVLFFSGDLTFRTNDLKGQFPVHIW